jgi:putative FmdB family regulatory protein
MRQRGGSRSRRQPGALECEEKGQVKEESAMPYYVFLCQDCNRQFTLSLRMSDLEKGEVVCPHCGSKRVVQQATAFSAVTSKKS